MENVQARSVEAERLILKKIASYPTLFYMENLNVDLGSWDDCKLRN